MIKIDNGNNISVTRGDSLLLKLFINAGDKMNPKRFLLKEHAGSAVYLGIMENKQDFENAIVKYKFDENNVDENGDVTVKIKATDTLNLEPDTYFYEIKLVYYDSDEDEIVNTIIPKSKFIVC